MGSVIGVVCVCCLQCSSITVCGITYSGVVSNYMTYSGAL